MLSAVFFFQCNNSSKILNSMVLSNANIFSLPRVELDPLSLPTMNPAHFQFPLHIAYKRVKSPLHLC